MFSSRGRSAVVAAARAGSRMTPRLAAARSLHATGARFADDAGAGGGACPLLRPSLRTPAPSGVSFIRPDATR